MAIELLRSLDEAAVPATGATPEGPGPVAVARIGRGLTTRRRWIPNAAAIVTGLGLGGSVALPVGHASAQSLAAPGAMARLAGDITAMTGTYLLLVMVLLAARIAPLESALGQDRLLRWHRRLASAPLALLTAHGVLTTLGYAQAGRLGIAPEAGSLVMTMAWVFAALVAYAMLVAVAGFSIRAARRRLGYDTWWVIHLYTYLALAFSVPHQILDGNDFVGHPLAKTLWMMLWLSTAGVVVVYRLGLPVARSIRHRLEVAAVRYEGPGVYSLVVRGRHVEKLAAAGGQYFGWRFLTRDLWWQAHPFSLSAVPAPPFMRVTIKVAGDATSRIATLRPGTKVAIEGPYGAFTDATRTTSKVALVGAGVGIAPLRALLEDLPPDVDVVLVHRASTEDQLVHGDELERLIHDRHGRAVTMVGSRRAHALDDPSQLRALVPDIATRDLYVCGPDRFSAGVVSAARELGLPASAVHHESFEF